MDMVCLSVSQFQTKSKNFVMLLSFFKKHIVYNMASKLRYIKQIVQKSLTKVKELMIVIARINLIQIN